MKLVVCVVHNRDRNRVTDELIKLGFKFTVIGSSGGFLREGNTTMLIGVDEDKLDQLKAVIHQNCEQREQMVNVAPFDSGAPGGFLPTPIKVPVGGAVMFVMNVDEFHRF
jgi:uncharacterized protein YaaQ